MNTIPSLGITASKPPIESNLLNCCFSLFNFFKSPPLLTFDIDDFKKYYDIIKNQQIDAVFGSRFIQGSRIIDYPRKKLILNRIFNIITKLLFISDYNDFTNAFKIYKKSALLKTFPLVSESFNILDKCHRLVSEQDRK